MGATCGALRRKFAPEAAERFDRRQHRLLVRATTLEQRVKGEADLVDLVRALQIIQWNLSNAWSERDLYRQERIIFDMEDFVDSYFSTR